MLQTQIFAKVIKEAPKDEKCLNSKLLIRAGFLHKEMAGIYSFLPLGLRVLKKVENIIREEMDKIGGQEILMPILQPQYLWEKTGRWEKGIGEVMYKTIDVSGQKLALGPTHEELLTNIISGYVKSYRDLPLAVYQISAKFRKELRAKSGLLRCREFIMKDLYSFHQTEADFEKYYQLVKKSYLKTLKRCGLEAIVTEASGAGFTKDFTHEFQVLTETGEDTIIYCPHLVKDYFSSGASHFSQNKEIAELKEGFKCPACGENLRQGRAIEVGNIFPLGTNYSEALDVYFADKDGKKKLIIMGCYGLGVSRLIGAIVEVHHDKDGIIWPPETAPFQVHLIPIEDAPKVKGAAEKVYQNLQKEGLEVLYDDREDRSAGEKFVEADLIGIPVRIVVSYKTLKVNSAEIKQRGEDKTKLVKISRLPQDLKIKNKI